MYISRITFAAALTLIGTNGAHAAVIVADSFDYVSGPLNGKNGGVGAWTAGWVGFGLNASFSMAVTNNDPPPKSAQRELVIQAGTSVVFVSFEFAPPTGATVNDSSLLRMMSGATVVASIGKPAGASAWSIGRVSFVSTGIPASDEARIVAAYDFNGDGARPVWVNPDAEDFFNMTTGASSADAVRVGNVPTQASSVSLDASIEGVSYDTLIIASDPSDVGLLASGSGAARAISTATAR